MPDRAWVCCTYSIPMPASSARIRAYSTSGAWRWTIASNSPIDLGIAAVARQRRHHIQPQILRRDDEGSRLISGRPLVRGAAGAAASRITSLPQVIRVARLVVITSDSSLRWSACTSRSTLISARTSACDSRDSEVSRQDLAPCHRASILQAPANRPDQRRRNAGSLRSMP